MMLGRYAHVRNGRIPTYTYVFSGASSNHTSLCDMQGADAGLDRVRAHVSPMTRDIKLPFARYRSERGRKFLERRRDGT